MWHMQIYAFFHQFFRLGVESQSLLAQIDLKMWGFFFEQS